MPSRAAIAISLSLVAAAVVPATSSASAGLSMREVEGLAKRDANRYIVNHLGIHGDVASWNARCWTIHRGKAPKHLRQFQCRMQFNVGQCTGSLRFSERRFESYRIRIGCGD